VQVFQRHKQKMGEPPIVFHRALKCNSFLGRNQDLRQCNQRVIATAK
jgi:hypothetical protein